jgi:hypothetical protein
VFFNTNNERAVRMVTALKNLDGDQLSRVSSFAQKITRYLAAINTQYNPIFGVINFLRDVQGGMIQLTDTPSGWRAEGCTGWDDACAAWNLCRPKVPS